ncbi:DoxX family protein [Nocardiopsis sp. LOL_012]|uniref:DoxX family protein n=1 Tax=Nocardiopsis sp. LOL_012 TaxID=3345409 RepID=UPI003A843E22
MTPDNRWERLRGAAPFALGGLFVASGLLHFAAPRPFEAIVPRSLPARRALVYGSGAAELACGAGLLARRRWAGPASAALLLAVWPANMRMALDAGSGRLPGIADNRALAWGRVPLQIPLVWAALQSRPRPEPGSAA